MFQSLAIDFQDGGPKPEVEAFRRLSRRARVISIVSDSFDLDMYRLVASDQFPRWRVQTGSTRNIVLSCRTRRLSIDSDSVRRSYCGSVTSGRFPIWRT